MISGKSGLAGKLLAAGRNIDLECTLRPPSCFEFFLFKRRFCEATAKSGELKSQSLVCLGRTDLPGGNQPTRRNRK
jgi:hypothetical protein